MVSTETVAAGMGAGKYAKPLEDACIAFGIVTPLEKAHFLAQVAHESDGFRTAEEYASGRAYEGRKDLGNTEPGDGMRFKGHGLIQITGRANHAAYSRWKYGDDRVMRDPKMLTRLPDAVDAAAWYWCIFRPSIRPLARADDVVGVTRKVNGGTNGLEDRKRRLAQAKKLFRVS
jgi:putative chitinase